jgi:hypothetical protein
MKKEFVGTQAVEFMQTALCKGPEAFDAVDMHRADRKLIRAMVDTKMLSETDIDKAVVTTPSVGVNSHFEADFTAYYGLQRPLLTVRNDLGIDPAVPFENAEDDGLAASSPAAFPANPPRTEIRFVDLYFTRVDRSVPGTFFDESNTDLLKDQVNAFPRDARQFSGLFSRQIQGKITQNSTKFLLRDSGTPIIPV